MSVTIRNLSREELDKRNGVKPKAPVKPVPTPIPVMEAPDFSDLKSSITEMSALMSLNSKDMANQLETLVTVMRQRIEADSAVSKVETVEPTPVIIEPNKTSYRLTVNRDSRGLINNIDMEAY